MRWTKKLLEKINSLTVAGDFFIKIADF